MAKLEPFSSLQYRKRTALSTTGDECCVCGRDTSGLDGATHVPVNHETGEFVTDAEIAALGDAANDKVSLYPIGPECAKKWRREFAATSNRFRRGRKGELIAFDVQEPKP